METMEQRRDAIVQMINQKGKVRFVELKEAFPQVSEMTLRTDLKALDNAKQIVRIHGGAKSVEVVIGTDDYYGQRVVRNSAAKQTIAEKAVQLIAPNTTIYLDSGSTATALAKIIPDQKHIIFTSGISCAMELARLERGEVYLPGGRINRYSVSVSGAESISRLQQINFDIAFIGVTCYSSEFGFSCGASEEAILKQTAMRRSEKTVILLDTSKIGWNSTFSICTLKDVDMVISNGDLPETFIRECAEAGVELL
ncbi:MAG: DeoR/GlpR transcriptional regulator [Eubacterium sp.]|nr:DeoR/GlpR transcriptional regulator [Eubacterium sp.]